MEDTIDPTTHIVVRSGDYIEYVNTDGKRWGIYGKCICCGLCELNNNESIPISGDITIQHNKILLEDGSFGEFNRILLWFNEPGISGACLESGYEHRLDIPLTPDYTNETPNCSFSGVWISGN